MTTAALITCHRKQKLPQLVYAPREFHPRCCAELSFFCIGLLCRPSDNTVQATPWCHPLAANQESSPAFANLAIYPDKYQTIYSITG